ncbi:MAG: tRNA lysidine(34) synthetase TilS [Chryseotalea sp.]
MLKQFISHLPEITGNNPVAQKFLLAVSGGVDSMVLAHLFYQSGLPFAIAHVNFQLRGEESVRDAAFVKNTAATWHVPYFEKTVDTRKHQQELKTSLQLAARELRYQWFFKLAKTENFDWVVTAHHINDRFETAMLNFMQGASPYALAGIREKSGIVIRPLLGFTKEEIVAYAQENTIAWREDSSNEKNDYTRNQLRNEVLPALYKWKPHWQSAFERTITKIEHEEACKAWALEEFKKQYVKQDPELLQISIAGLQAMSNATAIVYALLHPFGYNYDQCMAIAQSNLSASGNSFESLAYKLVVDRHYLFLKKKEPTEHTTALIEKPEGEYRLGKQKVTVKEVKKEAVVFAPNRAYFDADKVAFPLVWRTWQMADKLRPFGMYGTKNVSDILIDLKTPQPEKETQTVLASAGTIIWVVGKRQSEDFRLTESTKTAIEIEFSIIND